MRAWKLYSLRHGPLLSAGIGFTMFFSITGLLATGFSVAGLVLRGQPRLVDSTVESISSLAPGLLKTAGSDGLVDPYELLNPTGLGWTAAIAAAVTVLSSLGWIAGLREGLREVVGVDPLEQNPLLVKAIDAGTLLLLGVALVVSGGASIVFGTAAGWVIDWLRLDEAVAGPLTWLVRTAVPLLLNCATAAILFRLGGGLRLGRRAFVEGTVLAGVGTTILQIFSTELLARAGANPILASFAIIIGLLIWFNLISQVYLVSASWAAVREADEQAEDTPPKTLGSRHRQLRSFPTKGSPPEA
ncbi:YihY/virulence factor BrkB family protein [Arthrobacter sp. M4]|uniref:YihY/virulence factor BrkB family protein n=1 Tax=Arthrobacter sp. M4 TaxID=218160 RepID=UPI001CDCBC0F|nr:YihY/virulence factor BrkB family protein [Arthrobacter sp. M4]MCA4133510.1 YihY/virulence factor BrkB family protein [Arthrobacter sp. M4]